LTLSISDAFHTLKNMVIVPEQEAPGKSTTSGAEAPAAPMPAASPAAAVVNGSPSVDAGSTLDTQALEDHMEQAIQSNPAFAPVAAFLKMADNLKAAVPDDAQRYKAAQLATGTTSEVLIAAINSYAAILAGESATFERTYVATAQANVASLSDQERTLGEQIKSLGAQLAQLTSQKEDLAKQARAGTADIAKAKIDFDTVSGTIDGRYRELAQKLQQHLGGAANGQ
jgi:hypothetical protein